MSNKVTMTHDCPWLSFWTVDPTGLIVDQRHEPCSCLKKDDYGFYQNPGKPFPAAEPTEPGRERPPGSQTYEEINHPEHYTKGGIECYDFITSWEMDFASGNIVKYVTRAPYKGKRLSDLKKARWYLERLIQEAENDLADLSRD